MKKNFLITGPPGCGKTTMVKAIARSFGKRAGGFYTEEIRHRGKRTGFEVVCLDGRRCLLAGAGLPSRHRVGRYRVAVEEFEGTGVAALREAVAVADLLVIDEIGKMELFSQAFKEAALACLDSGKPLLAAVKEAPDPFVDGIKEREDVKVFRVARPEYEKVKEEVLGELMKLLG